MVMTKRSHSATIPEAAMPSLTIRNLPAGVHAALVRRAKAHGRSLNRELVEILRREAEVPAIDPREALRDLREWRRTSGVRPIPDIEVLLRGKREGLE